MSHPAHKLRDRGRQVTIWRNPTENGVWYSVNISRSYKKGDDWKRTESLGSEDLLAMAKLLNDAHTWIVAAKKADAKARKTAATESSSDSQESAQAAA